jgi:hypothetical protein
MEGSINQEVAPVVQVKRTNDTYRIYDRNFRIPATLRAEKGLARQHYFDVSLGSYNLESHALKDYVGVDDKDNFDEIDYRADTVVELTEKIEMRAEKSCAALAATTSFSNGVSLATAAQWSLDTTASNPIPMVDTGTSVIMSNSNVKPNWMVCPRDSFVAAKNHASVIDRVKYTSKELDENILAGLFSIQKLLVPFVNEDTAVRGETASLSNIWTSDFVLLGYSPGKAGPRTLSTFYRFQKNTPAVRTWIDDEREGAEAIEVAKKYQFKVVASLTAYYINNAV